MASRIPVLPLLAVLLALHGCEAGPGVDPVSEGLLAEHGLRIAGDTTTRQLIVWELADEGMPWKLYLEASRRIGLDFSSQRGAEAELRTTPVEGPAPALRAYVLVTDHEVIGAWLSSEDDATGSSAIYPLSDVPATAT